MRCLRTGIIMCIPVFCLLFSLAVLCSVAYPDGPGETDNLHFDTVFLLPDEIVSSYFPGGDMYMIPEDQSISALIERAESSENKNNFRQASKYYFLAYKKVRNTERAPYIRFKHSTLLEDLDLSISVLTEVLEDYPDFPLIDAVRFELSKRYFLKKDYESAIVYLKVIEDNEKEGSEIFTPYVYTFLGIINFKMKNFDAAAAYYTQSIEKLSAGDPSSGRMSIISNYLGLARSLLELNEYEYIEDLLKRIIGSSQSKFFQQDAVILLADFYRKKGAIENTYSAIENTYSAIENTYSAIENAVSAIENAVSAYYWLIQSYPGSLFAIKAREGIEELNINEDGFQPVIISGIYDESLLNGTYRLGDKAEHRPGEGGEEGEAVVAVAEGYAVQLGSFSEEKNAENFIYVLKERGFRAYSITAVIENGTVFRVRVGAVASLKEAEEMKKTLEDMGYQGFIVKEK